MMNEAFTLANCFALAGGFLGALVVSDYKRYGTY
jgi:predicted membrane protein